MGSSGTLIHKSWVLTGGHCLEEDTCPEDVAVCLRSAGFKYNRQFKWTSQIDIRPGYAVVSEEEPVAPGEIEVDQVLIRLR